MFQVINIAHIVVLVLVLKCALCQDEIGQKCTLKKANKVGECKLVQDCPDAIKEISLNINSLQICGFQETLAIICCPIPNNPNVITSTTSTTTTTTRPIISFATINTDKKSQDDQTEKPNVRIDIDGETTSPPILRVGDKSRAKCLEYKKYVYSYPTLGGAPVNECKAEIGIPLIIGGHPAIAKEFPHMALVGFINKNNMDETLWLCGGSLISERFILTAAHCLKHSIHGDAAHVRVGDLELDTDTDDVSPQDFNIIEIFKHPRYFPASRYNDIGLLKLNKDAILNSFVRPACLHLQPALNFAKTPIATGWGQTGHYSAPSKVLLKVILEYFTHEECKDSYKSNIGLSLRKGITLETQLCAGSHNESKDACQGDSGGPLQEISDEVYCMYNIIGITSFGKTCGVANVPGVYTRVYNYIQWIEDIVWP